MSTLTQLDPVEAAKLFYAGHPLAFVDEPDSPFVCGQWMGRLAYITPLPFDADTAADYFTSHPVMMAGTSVETPPTPGVPPVNVDPPQVQQSGQTVVATQGVWADPQPDNFFYQWQRDGANVGTGGAVLSIGDDDVGHAFSCNLTGFNAYGGTTVASNTIGIT